VYIYIVDYGFSPRGGWDCVERGVGGLGSGGVCAGEGGGGEVELWCGFFGGTGVGRGGGGGLLMGSEEFMWLERGPREDGEGF